MFIIVFSSGKRKGLVISMRKSKGKMSGSRNKMRKSPREKGMPPVTRYLQEFKKGDVVHIDVVSSEAGHGMPNPKFQGRTGKVIGTQGKAYKVEVRDGNATKLLLVLPVHLKVAGIQHSKKKEAEA